ncbi:nitrogen permease regulator 2 [Periconia macrospinosa]|uniref:Nitrogen permease regulator 2 n=1 Tax=Periconia macrospinosa TaxID=97972 RepID=A0A2V1E9B8_9PLEO|nr:nitrogen permease regulator 2 [Periconia macrospinosa]
MPTRAIKSIFFTRFHHEKGSRVLHQVPEGSITPSSSPSALRNPLFTFSSVTSYLIPSQQFCDRLLTFCTNHYRVISYPVCIRENKYHRNEFIFNFALVVEEDLTDWVAYGEVARKLGRLLRGLEEQGGFLSNEEIGMGIWEDDGSYGLDASSEGYYSWNYGTGGGSKVHALCEMVLEDLNNYAECMIPIDDSNTINLKLFPTRPPPPPIYAHTVPLLTMSLSTLSRPLSSDLTLARILPHINGINSVSHIAQFADTDLSLTRKAIQHLVYYNCLVLLDVFSFNAIYAPTAEIGGFVVDEAVGEECGRYVCIPHMQPPTSGPSSGGLKMGSDSIHSRDARSSTSSVTSQHSLSSFNSYNNSHSTTPLDPPSASSDNYHSSKDEYSQIPHSTLITLYTSLRQGLTLRNWVLENLPLLSGIDIRRLITFGIIKGFLYRIHKYAVASSITLPPAPPTSLQSVGDASTVHSPGGVTTTVPHHLLHKPSIASTLTAATTSTITPGINVTSAERTRATDDSAKLNRLVNMDREQGLPLVKFLDGMHCFDEICTELALGEKVVEVKVRSLGEVQVFSR